TGNNFVSIVASEPAEQSANTRYGVLSVTAAAQERATSPDSVLAVSPLSSTGPLARTSKMLGTIAPVAPTPPLIARVPPGQVAAPSACPVLGTCGAIGLATIVASEVAEQMAKTRQSPAAAARQPRATSPVSVVAGTPVASTGPLSNTSAWVPVWLTPPPTARLPAGHVAIPVLTLFCVTLNEADTIVASEPGVAAVGAAVTTTAAEPANAAAPSAAKSILGQLTASPRSRLGRRRA